MQLGLSLVASMAVGVVVVGVLLPGHQAPVVTDSAMAEALDSFYFDPETWWPDPSLRRSSGQAPNFLVVLTDDQSVGMLEVMPNVRERIFEAGLDFENAYVTTPLCCPSRVSILTGQYASTHGTETNFDLLTAKADVVTALHRHGYYTGHVGKFINAWNGDARPEYDYWMAHEGTQSRYFDPLLNHNGVWSEHPGYITDIFADAALEFLDQTPIRPQPWALFFWPNAPHGPAEPASQDLATTVPRVRVSPAVDEVDVMDKPGWLQALPTVSREDMDRRNEFQDRQLRTLMSVDRAVGRILDRIEALGVMEETVIFFLSDNGLLMGEHRVFGKYYVYEEATHVPMAVRYDAAIEEPSTTEALVANIDIAPTIYDLASITPPLRPDGVSLRTLMERPGMEAGGRTHLFLEGWPADTPPWKAIRQGRFVYVETVGDRPELYDLEADAYQLENRAGDESLSQVQDTLALKLHRWRTG